MVRAWRKRHRQIEAEDIVSVSDDLLDQALYNTNPEGSYPLLHRHLLQYGGELRALRRDEYEKHLPLVRRELANSGIHLKTRQMNGREEIMEKAGIMALAGTLAAIDEGAIREGETVLSFFTGGAGDFSGREGVPECLIKREDDLTTAVERYWEEIERQLSAESPKDMRASPSELEEVARREQVPVAALAAALAAGAAVVITSKRGVRPVGIGKGLRAKFACIVGTSTAEPEMEAVLRKAQIAVDQGAAVVHNGSAGGNVREMQRRLLDTVAAPLAVCHPIGVMADACYRQRPFVDLEEGDFIEAVRRDIEQGIEVLLLPLGVSRAIVAGLKNSGRVMPCCSKSGSIMSAWIAHNNQENPYYRHFDDILALAKEHGTTLSVVGSFRSGCIHDALDALQYDELKTIREYVGRARKPA